MMLTIGSFVSSELPGRVSLITIPRLLTTFTKNVLNISATFLLREIISSFWVSAILLRLIEILFARKGFTVFQKFLLPAMSLASKFSKNFFFLSKKTDTVISLLLICRFVRLSFIFQKFVMQPRVCHHCFLKCLIHKWALICPYVTLFYRTINIKHFFKYVKKLF